MKREDLAKLGLTAEALAKAALPDDLIDQIMALHGKDIESHKSKLTEATSSAEALKKQLDDASKQIESFKSLKPEELQKAADDWKSKFEQAQKEATAQVARLKFDHALTGELSKAQVRNAKAILPLLDMEALQKGFNEKDLSFLGLDKQLEAIKTSDAYLFAETDETPRIVSGGNNSTVLKDSFMEAAFKGAKLNMDGK